MALDNRVKFNFETKPYPKKDKEVEILAEKFLKVDGVVNEKWETVKYSDEELSSIW